ncbi:hypothetical protein PSHT_14828 [Puccinia striiformis]|uniref:Uncharacterized protein n=1 Tax=Puccinia striiformis TaxID=27350 RepID=A0A2S4UI46_9BASI|nr:hypothetical protein PSHT_14828 [Puccinia striiformis]
MGKTETFLAYNTRARTLQSLINFGIVTMTNVELAEAITHGLTEDLRALVNNFQLLYQKPFDFTTFKRHTSLFCKRLPKRPQNCVRGPTGQLMSSPQQPLTRSKEENVWRLHSYLDSVGLCQHFNKACGSPMGACPGEKNQSYVKIPSLFVTPTKPATSKGQTTATVGRPTLPPAGRPANRAATVAGILDEGIAPALDQASISAMEDINEELRLAIQEGYVPPLKPRRIIVLLTHVGKSLPHILGEPD